MSNPDSNGAREKAIYAARFSREENDSRDSIWGVLVRDYFQAFIDPAATVVDLGCGFGEFLKHVRCARRIGVDLSPHAGDVLAQQGIEHHLGSITDLGFLPAESVDFVFTSNVFEHLPSKQDVDAVLREVHRVLRAGGQFVMMGPNIRFVTAEYWDYWDHYLPISDRSLAEALRIAGFEVVEQIDRFMPYTTKSRLPQADWMVRLYLRNRWAWRILGKQFLLRARR